MPKIPRRLVTLADLIWTVVFVAVATPVFFLATIGLAAVVAIKTPFLAARAAITKRDDA
jgi:hypothetical protein